MGNIAVATMLVRSIEYEFDKPIIIVIIVPTPQPFHAMHHSTVLCLCALRVCPLSVSAYPCSGSSPSLSSFSLNRKRQHYAAF